jgi:ABC-2 type transport system ATP-binding protein
VLLTTHYLDEAQHLAAKVVVLAGGRVVADATPGELRAMGGVPVIRYRPPAHPVCRRHSRPTPTRRPAG